MIAPPPIFISEDDTGNSSATPRYRGEMARVVSMELNSTSSSSLVKLDPVMSASSSTRKSVPPDDPTPTSEARGPALHQNAIPPIVQSRSTLSIVGAQIIPSAKDGPRPIVVRSLDNSPFRGNAESEFTRQGQSFASTYKKCSANTVSGRWTPAEHEAFLQGLKVYGREWKKVATCIPTRTSAQIRSHAQKYFAKVTREQQQLLSMTEQRRASFPDMPPKPDATILKNDQPRSKNFVETMNSIVNNPHAVETRVCQTLASLRERYKQLEIRLQQNRAPAPVAPPVKSGEVTALGPATAALELEQTSLRKAAVARYELKARENQLRNRQQTVRTETNDSSCAHVSLASMPSQGGFDSSDVLALSRLGGSLGREKIENKTISTIKDASGLKLVRDRLRLMERPTKVRKLDEH